MNYKCVFNGIGDRLDTAFFTNRHGETSSFRVKVDDSQLRYQSTTPPQVADLVDLASAIYVADRLSIRKKDCKRYIQVELPVRHRELFQKLSLMELLKNVLYFYTEDNWSFEFQERKGQRRLAEDRGALTLGNEEREVALWSGGLDSLAGLWTQITKSPQKQFTLFGTGSSDFILKKQQEIADLVRKTWSKSINLIQVPLNLWDVKRQEPTQRTRGLFFLLLGSACAYLEGQNKLFVYENGVGALNLSCRESEVGIDHAKSVHPRSLLEVSDLVSHIFDTPFSIQNPFLFWTKAQMCKVLQNEEEKQIALKTISCDSRRRESGRIQCGKCSSCILRRQALAAAGIEDKTGYFSEQLKEEKERIALEAMLYQVENLRDFFAAPSPWNSLIYRYPELDTVAYRLAKKEGITSDLIAKRLIELYQNYLKEWDLVRSIIDSRVS